MLDVLSRNGRGHTANDEGTSAPTLFRIAGDEATIDGTFNIADSLEIQCEVSGKLEVGRKITILEDGVVNGEVQTVDAVIMGTFEGQLVATGEVKVTETGRVDGDIVTNSLVISKGGVFTGNVEKIKDRPAERPADSDDGRRWSKAHS